MRKIAEALLRLDRRIIFLLMAVVALLPTFFPVLIDILPPLQVTQSVKAYYDAIENLPPGSVIWLSFDFDPGSAPELQPMAAATIRHAFMKNHRVIAMCLWDTGVDLARKILNDVVAEFEKKGIKKVDTEDYIFLGWQPGTIAVITNLGIDINNIFPKDYEGRTTKDMKIFEGVKNLKDINFLSCFAAGTPGIETWIVYGADKFKFKMGGGCTAVIEPGLRPFLNTGQLIGLLGAAKGAAEYEQLLKYESDASKLIKRLSWPQFLVGILVVLSCIMYALVGRRR